MRPGLAARQDEPETPTDIDEKALPFSVRAELRGLPKELGSVVAAHLVAAGELVDEDPELAYRHAEAARRRAARLPVVREATAETAYAAGEFAVALNEYRALRRMTGGAEYLPVMADCERALGRPENALRLAREAADAGLDADQQVEMLLVEAGSRDDMGNRPEALRLLKNGISRKLGSRLAQARLRYAYADLQEREGHTDAARALFVTAGQLDHEHTLDVDDRVNKLDGFVLELGEDDEDDEDAELEERPEVDEDGDVLPAVAHGDSPADEDDADQAAGLEAESSERNDASDHAVPDRDPLGDADAPHGLIPSEGDDPGEDGPTEAAEGGTEDGGQDPRPEASDEHPHASRGAEQQEEDR